MSQQVQPEWTSRARDGATGTVEIDDLSLGQTLESEELRSAWLDLAVDQEADYSLTPVWIEAAAQGLGVSDKARVLIARRGNTTVGFLPYLQGRQTVSGVPLSTIDLLGNQLVTYHHEIVARGAHRHLLAKLLDGSCGKWHLFRAAEVLAGSETELAVRECLSRYALHIEEFAGSRSPYLPFAFDSWETYYRTKKHKFRANMKRKLRLLGEAGQLSEHWFVDSGSVPRLLEDILEIESQSWKVEHGMAVSTRTVEKRYHEVMLPALARAGTLFANVIYLDGTPVAYNLCYNANGRVGQMKTSFDDRLRRLSPGSAVNYFALKRAFDTDGVNEYDFLGDEMPHKREWTDTVRPHVNLQGFARGLRPSIAYAIRRTRERLKRGFRRTPSGTGRAAP